MNGNKYEVKKEYQGNGPFPLEFSWTYNSIQRNPLNGINQFPQQFMLGAGRQHNYSQAVKVVNQGGVPAYAYVYRPDGNIETYTRVQAQWVSEADNPATLMEKRDVQNVQTGWIRQAFDDRREEFSLTGRLVRIVDRSGLAQDLSYDGADRLQSVVDSTGRSIVFGYNASSQLVTLGLPDGNQILFSYDSTTASAANLGSVTYPGGSVVSYHYGEAGWAADVSQPHALTGVVDESGARYSSTYYNASHQAVGTELAGGVDKYSAVYTASASFNYTESAVITGPLGQQEVGGYAAIQGIARRTSQTSTCSGCVSRQSSSTFDTAGRSDVSTDFGGNTTDYDYDTRGLLVRQVNAANDTTGAKRIAQTDWHADFHVPVERRAYNAGNALVAKSNWTYNSRGQALTDVRTDPASNTSRSTTTTYCEQADIGAGSCPLLGLVTAIDGPRADVADTTVYVYYPSDDPTCATASTTCPHRRGDLWKVIDALGQTTETLKYDGAGRVLSTRDANGSVTDYEYHPRGWLTATKVRGGDDTTEADDRITRVEYWPTGLVKQVTQPDGSFTAYVYDAAHRLTDVVDGLGNAVHYTLDNAGNRTQEETKDASGTLKRTLSRVFNQLGQLQTQKDALNHPTEFIYDANGNTDQVTDALGRVTDNDYDPLNRLKRTLQDVGGIAAETKFEYDAQDNLIKVTDPKGLNTTYVYNGLGDLLTLGSPDTGTAQYTYDSAGNRKTQTDARGITATYSYDALNRLTGIVYATSGLNVSYTYDVLQSVCIAGETFSVGRLAKLTDGSGTTQYCYDRFGNLVRKVQTSNGKVFILRYAYTKAGQLQSVTYPDGAVADYVRDAQGRVTEVGVARAGNPREVLLNQVGYAPFGPTTSWTYGNGRSLIRTYNQNYQPVAIQDTMAGGLDWGFGFDAVGNLTLLTRAANPTPVVSFDYDSLNRLTAFRDQPANVAIESYAYDKTGNRTSFTNASGVQAYTYPATSHRLSSVGLTARTYDAAGNTTQIGGTNRQFVYDDSGRMSQVKSKNKATMNYAYNGKGEQVRKYLGTASTYAMYDEAGHWLGDYDTNGVAIQQAIWLDDMPVGVVANNQLHYIEPDHLGTPRVVIHPARNAAIWSWDLKSEAFGNSPPNQNPDGDANQFAFNLRFPGQRYDPNAGMNYNYFRDYDKDSGRYVQSDPIGLLGGISTYGYVLGQPMQLYDKFGLNPAAVVSAAVVMGAIQGCAGGCAGAIVGDYASCVIKKRMAGGKNLGQCSDECTPNPCDALRSCISGCIAGAIIGGATAGRGVVFTPVAGYLLKKYFRFLFSPDFCQKYGIPAPPNPTPIPLPDWLRDL